MRTISIYNAAWRSFGGGEKYALAIAEHLSLFPEARVRILVDAHDITKDRLSGYFNLDLKHVELLHVAEGDIRPRLAESDLAVMVSNYRSFGLPAKRNVYVLQIPYQKIGTFNSAFKIMSGQLREGVKDSLRRSLLSTARKADASLVYSLFVADVLKEHHSINATVLYPPIDDFRSPVSKEKMVLSVGRFFSGLYNDKRYDILVGAFRKLYEGVPGLTWRYTLVGSCGEDEASQAYLASLKKSAEGLPVDFVVNAPYEDVKTYYNRATIFWHAAGYGVDETKHPERLEHFGMTTVEAMSAGCIPVVINSGGQREIIGTSGAGFLWHQVDELVNTTAGIVDGSVNVDELSRKARGRYADFSREAFRKHADAVFTPLLT